MSFRGYWSQYNWKDVERGWNKRRKTIDEFGYKYFPEEYGFIRSIGSRLYDEYGKVKAFQRSVDEYFHQSKRRDSNPTPSGSDRSSTDEESNPDNWVHGSDNEQKDNGGDPVEPIATDMTKGITSHSAEHCCVDLGSMDMPVRNFQHIDHQYVGPRNRFIGQHTESHWPGTADKVEYFVIGDPRYEIQGGESANPIPIASADDGQSNNLTGIQFNSTSQLLRIFGSTGLNLTWPSYGYTNPLGVTNPNDANRAVILSNQYIEIKIKNIGEYGGSGVAFKDTPCFLTLYAYQLTDDIYFEQQVSTVTKNGEYILSDRLSDGWRSFYAGGTPGIDQLNATNTQQYGTSIHDNEFLNTFAKCLGTSKHCLAMGQEGTFRVMIKSPQYFNFNDFVKATVRASDATPTTTYWHIAHRKGEIFFVGKISGGLGAKSHESAANRASGANLQIPQVIIYSTIRYDFFEILKSQKNPKIRFDPAINTNPDSTIDTDIQDYFG